jgi:hypothetical protein
VASQGHGASPHKPAASAAAAAATAQASPAAAASSVKQEQQHTDGQGGRHKQRQASSMGRSSNSPRQPAHRQLMAEDSEVEPSEEEAGLFDYFVTSAAGNSRHGASSEQGPGAAAGDAAGLGDGASEALGKRGRSAPPVGQAPAAAASNPQVRHSGARAGCHRSHACMGCCTLLCACGCSVSWIQ